MSTQQSAQVFITNRSDGKARILLFHNNSSNGTQHAEWSADAGQEVGPLEVKFKTGFGSGTILDYWSVVLEVEDGSTPGRYVSTGSTLVRYWKECQLQHQDAGQTLRLTVSPSQFDINLRSGGCTDAMEKIAPPSDISHVFVVMLENRSFDNIFGFSGIPGIRGASTADTNSFIPAGKTEPVTCNAHTPAPVQMPTDPGHEFPDVLEQLAGKGATYPAGGPYPKINNSGFASNYAHSALEGTGLPTTSQVCDIMGCFDTPKQLPVIFQLATEFAISDHWYSSIPGPTWPNRFFLHGASSAGFDKSPGLTEILGWEIGGFPYPNGSIFQHLESARIPYRLYHDVDDDFLSLYSDNPRSGSVSGAIPQASSIQGARLWDFHSLDRFARDLQGPYPFPYTFIEPHYGDLSSNTYKGGSSQHPEDDVFGGENLLRHVYEAIRNSPHWDNSLLVVIYDEHGGFYDSVAPGPTVNPGDHEKKHYNKYGFNFEQLGVRVPAVLVSPRIPKGTVANQHTYEHSSVLATLEKIFDLDPLTKRDAMAQSLCSLLSLAEPRTDCPRQLHPPAPSVDIEPLTASQKAAAREQPLPAAGNFLGTLAAVRKADRELSKILGIEAEAELPDLAEWKTMGDAAAYIESVVEKLKAARERSEEPPIVPPA